MRLSIMKVFKRFVLQFEDLSKTHALVYNQTLIMLTQLKTFKDSKKDVSTEIEKAIQSGGIKMVRTMMQLGVKRKQRSRTIGIYLIAILKKYKKYIIA